MPRHLGCRNVSEYRYVVERMNERGEWTSKHYVSQRDIAEELGITVVLRPPLEVAKCHVQANFLVGIVVPV